MSDAVLTITANDIAGIIENRAEVEDGYLCNAGHIAHEIYLTILAASTPVGGWEDTKEVDLASLIPATDDLHRHAVEIYGTARNLGPDNLASFAHNCIEQFVIDAAPPPPSVSTDKGSRPQEAAPTEQADRTVVARLVDRFLSWKLPETFNPDGGVRFDKDSLHPAHWPSGTNLLDHTQATEMVRHILAGETR